MAVVEGNPFVGLFARASDRLVIVSLSAPEKFVEKCRATMKADVRPVSMSACNLVGIFAAMNSNGVVLSCTSSKEEADAIKALGLNASIQRGRFTAVGSNVLANDKAAVVNPQMPKADVDAIRDTLGVEVVKRKIAGFATVGAAGVVTNRGLIAHGATTDEELAELEGIFGVKGAIGTANMGIGFVGLCLVANSNGYVCGERTSGFEMSRIDEGLGFIR